MRVAIQRSPNSLNPLLAANTTESFLNRLSFDTLISTSADGRHAVPILAQVVPTTTNGGISPDGLTITYHLRANVEWQDGAPLTSHDVAFTWRAIMNDANNVNTRNGYDHVASVETPNPTTVVFHLKSRFAPFINTVFAESDDPFCILPEHLLGRESNLNRLPFNTLPVGSGPFIVKEWVRGDHIELVANEHYFRGKPKLKRILVREIPDENSEINALRSHDIDWMFEASPATIAALRPLERDGSIRLIYNDQPQTLRLYMNTAQADLADVSVRRAIAYALDKRVLVDRLTYGTALPGTADQPPFSEYYEPNVTRYLPDRAKAKALLRAAGYTFGQDGMATKHGQQLRLTLSYNVENATRRNAVVQIQAMLEAVGIAIDVKSYPANLLFATFGQGGILTNAKYDLAVSGWIAGIDPDDNALYGCDQFPPKGTNYSRYCSPAMDALQRQALSTYDLASRKNAYSAIQKLLASDVPDIDIWYPRQLQPINPAFQHFTPNPVNEAWNAFEWEI